MVLTSGGAEYKTIILPGCNYIPVNTFKKILSLSEQGATIIVSGNLPENFSGWADLESNRKIFQKLKERLNFTETAIKDIKQAIIGTGKVIIGNDLNQLLSFAGIRRETIIDNGLSYSRRAMLTRSLYFILNQTDKLFDGWMSLQVKGKSAVIFNPLTGISGVAETRLSISGNLEVYSRLLPYESIIVETSDTIIDGDKFIYYNAISSAKEIQGKWKVDFIEGGPELPLQKK